MSHNDSCYGSSGFAKIIALEDIWPNPVLGLRNLSGSASFVGPLSGVFIHRVAPAGFDLPPDSLLHASPGRGAHLRTLCPFCQSDRRSWKRDPHAHGDFLDQSARRLGHQSCLFSAGVLLTCGLWPDCRLLEPAQRPDSSARLVAMAATQPRPVHGALFISSARRVDLVVLEPTNRSHLWIPPARHLPGRANPSGTGPLFHPQVPPTAGFKNCHSWLGRRQPTVPYLPSSISLSTAPPLPFLPVSKSGLTLPYEGYRCGS